MDDRNFEVLKKISDKLTWALVFLFIIMLNTCSLSDDIEDSIRDRRDEAVPAQPANPPAPAEPASPPAPTEG